MADRLDYYFRQRVTEAELDLGFELLERADRNLAGDLGFVGVLANAVVSQHAPVPDLTVDVSGPGASLDQLGQRIFFSALQNVNVAQDDNAVSTDVSAAGKEKIVSVFVKFDRVVSDPRVDGNSLTVFFRRDESFKFIVAQGAEANAGGAIPPPLRSDAILLADVTRTFAQTQVLNSNLSTSRRQDAFVATATPRSIRRGRTLEAVTDLLTFYNAHANGTADRHAASAIDYAGGDAWADGTVNPATTAEAQLDKVVADLTAAAGAARVGAAATAGAPNSLLAGTVKSQIDALLALVNAANAAAAIAYAGGGPWADGTANPATTVEGQLDKILSDLAGADGADKVGTTVTALWADGSGIAATRIKTALDEVLADLAGSGTGADGAQKVGAAAYTPAGPNTLPAGTVRSQLVALEDDINDHVNFGSGAHAATAITYAGGPAWKDGTTNPGSDVEAQLDKIVGELAADAGGARIGAGARANWEDGRANPAASVFGALDKVVTDLNDLVATKKLNLGSSLLGIAADAILPRVDADASTAVGANLTLMWESAPAAQPGSRIYMLPAGGIVFTFNARWDNVSWNKDVAGVAAAKVTHTSSNQKIERRTTDAAWTDVQWEKVALDLALATGLLKTSRLGLGADLLGVGSDTLVPRISSQYVPTLPGGTYQLLWEITDAAAVEAPVRLYSDVIGDLLVVYNASWDGTVWSQNTGGRPSVRFKFNGFGLEIMNKPAAFGATWIDSAWNAKLNLLPGGPAAGVLNLLEVANGSFKVNTPETGATGSNPPNTQAVKNELRAKNIPKTWGGTINVDGTGAVSMSDGFNCSASRVGNAIRVQMAQACDTLGFGFGIVERNTSFAQDFHPKVGSYGPGFFDISWLNAAGTFLTLSSGTNKTFNFVLIGTMT